MPPAVAGAAIAAWGIGTAATMTALVTAVYVGAAVGAVVGAAGAAIRGDNIFEGAVKGAVIGGVSAGILKGAGLALSAGSSGANAGVGSAGLNSGAVEAGTGAVAEGTAANAVAPAAESAVGTATQAPTQTASTGLLSKASNFIETNPNKASLIGQSLGGAAKSMAESRASEKEIDFLMERDRLNREAQQIGGLDKLDMKSPLPLIGTFAQPPQWQAPASWQQNDSGLLWEGMKKNEKPKS